jgi:hypothetical protein
VSNKQRTGKDLQLCLRRLATAALHQRAVRRGLCAGGGQRGEHAEREEAGGAACGEAEQELRERGEQQAGHQHAPPAHGGRQQPVGRGAGERLGERGGEAGCIVHGDELRAA